MLPDEIVCSFVLLSSTGIDATSLRRIEMALKQIKPAYGCHEVDARSFAKQRIAQHGRLRASTIAVSSFVLDEELPATFAASCITTLGKLVSDMSCNAPCKTLEVPTSRVF